MGLNLSNRQISQELDLDQDVVQDMTTLLRHGIVQRNPDVKLAGSVECDEVYVKVGHKENPEAVLKKGAKVDDIDSRGFGVEARLKK